MIGLNVHNSTTDRSFSWYLSSKYTQYSLCKLVKIIFFKFQRFSVIKNNSHSITWFIRKVLKLTFKAYSFIILNRFSKTCFHNQDQLFFLRIKQNKKYYFQSNFFAAKIGISFKLVHNFSFQATPCKWGQYWHYFKIFSTTLPSKRLLRFEHARSHS